MNTFNVCIGHKPFPEKYADLVDLAIGPNVYSGGCKRKAIVPDELYGEHGHALSEYGQLFWLANRIDALAPNASYVNLFQYRRFVSTTPVNGERAVNADWMMVIPEDELDQHRASFSREQPGACFNTPIRFGHGVLGQYAHQHVLEDMLNFTKFLMEIEMFSPDQAAKFLRYEHLIPACSCGVYEVSMFKKLFAYLERAADFLHSPYFIARESYQRRSVGYMLERLQSFIILELMSDGAKFGQNVLISDVSHVSPTTERVN
ncbi:hypothetical protein [Herbaspirillum sp. alder98]|uniref:hypothetical protein n=1 Tax=Herbaspirillum sp. alder98 TaxID=2913096 RepID=UPI001CD89F38|nr:hypothetical protein [Herbaspirillum sp. alder98]MCA1326254.1 hypothetical protein [Herbaspirillum sp. alder98]